MQTITSYIHHIQQQSNNTQAKQLFAEYEAFPIPTKRLEDWKFKDTQDWFTSLYTFTPPSKITQQQLDAAIESLQFDALLVFENGLYHNSFSRPNSIASAITNDFEADIPHCTNKFECASLIGAQSGAAIHVAAKHEKQHVLIVSFFQGNQSYSLQKNRIYVHADSHIIITELQISLSDEPIRINHSVSIKCMQKSSCEYTSVQHLGSKTELIQTISCLQEQESTCTISNFPISGAYVRTNVYVDKIAPHSHTFLHGFFFPAAQEHFETYVEAIHNAPECETHQLYQSIAKDNGIGVFSGKLHVAREAQKTNTTQNNKNILLSKTAKIHSKPQLEIYADDVSCTHGSTTGQIDNEALWYMQTRGISREAATKLLLKGFITDVISKVSNESVKNAIMKALENKL